MLWYDIDEKTGRGTVLMKNVKTINEVKPASEHKKVNCGECQVSCQSACKTSCTVANQTCENK